jgi:16S rRNA (cytidine1402-2'-O)-methyltransferase
LGDHQPSSFRRGALYVCATPLGNLEDLSPRALRLLAECDIIAAERPSHTLKLLAHFGIPAAKLRPAAESTSERALAEIVAAARAGAVVAAVSDAGTPGISDPGSRLVRLAIAAGVPVSPVPGPSAVPAALSVSGFDTRRVTIRGFLPRKPGPRQEELRGLLATGSTLVLFESPSRVADLLRDLAAECPDRQLALLREATKLHEEVVRGTAAQVSAAVGEARGEFTIVVSCPDPGTPPGDQAEQERGWLERTRALTDHGLRGRDVVRALMVLGGLSKSRAFDIARQAGALSDPAGDEPGDEVEVG